MLNNLDNNSSNNNFSEIPDNNNPRPIVISSYTDNSQNDSNNGKIRKKKNPKLGVIALTVCCCIVSSSLFGIGGAYFAVKNMDNNNQQIPISNNSNNYQHTSTVNYDYKEDSAISNVAKIASNSVVEISTEVVDDNYFMGQYVTEGAGSGVIISNDGYIITNDHVIDGSSKITVTLKDGTKYPATLIGTDEETDIAVIKVDAENLQSAVYGNSDNLIVGQKTVVIGNPLGQLGGTVTDGIISALDREIKIGVESMTLLQTNAEINPGNSGGGMFNIGGELIGIINAKSTGTSIEGLGFAIPINTAKDVADQIIANGYVMGRPKLGLNLIDVSDANSAMMYRLKELGVYVYSSENKDFLSGDYIMSIDDTKVSNISEIKSLLKLYKVGDTITIKVKRDGNPIDIKLTLTESAPENKKANISNASVKNS